jgi:tetratricopeptide (TPR) repeat protein
MGQSTGGSLGTSQISNMDRTLTLLVSVREQNGLPLGQQAIVRLSTDLGGQNIMGVTRDGATASFLNMKGGDYVIDVESIGYKPAHERASVVGVSSYTVYVYMTPEGAAESSAPTDARPVMTPKLQKEMDRALSAIQEKKYAEARQHLQAASKLAPSNPDIEYLMGMVDYTEHILEPARAHFEKALGLAPGHERTLVSLGQLQMEMKDYKKSAGYLETAVLNNAKNSQAHLLLSVCYINSQNFSKARMEALAAADLDKAKGPIGHMIAAKTYLMEKNYDEATKALGGYLRDYPNEKGAAEATQLLEQISAMRSASVAPEPRELPVAHTPALMAIEHPWAPPDTDEKIPTVASDVVCSTEDVVKHVGAREKKALADLERFGATERIDHQEIDSLGNGGSVKSHDFSYMILVHHPSQDSYFVEERRDGGDGLYLFPTTLATRGLVSIGVNLFRPEFRSDFTFSCEGLGRWDGHPAWLLRFEQKKDLPSRIRVWFYHGKAYAIPLKGRVWISPNTFDLIHLETDLRDRVKELQLIKEHLSIAYGPVNFKQVKEQLWLPQSAEMYFSLSGKRYHHRHTLSDYVLFSVDEKSKIGAPAQPPADSEPKQP